MLPPSGAPQYYVEDMLGSSRVVTTNTGVVCYDADFYPYGGESAITNNCPAANKYKFEGKERDDESGNDDFGARYYSWRFGRWLSADWSAVPAPVPYANLTNPQTLNLYAMVHDDPETFADLDGHEDLKYAINDRIYGYGDSNYDPNSLSNVGNNEAQKDDAQRMFQAHADAIQKAKADQNRSATPEDKAQMFQQAGKMADAGVKAGLAVVGTEAAVAGAVVAAPTVIPAASQAGTATNATTTNLYVQASTALSAAGTAVVNVAGAVSGAAQSASSRVGAAIETYGALTKRLTVRWRRAARAW